MKKNISLILIITLFLTSISCKPKKLATIPIQINNSDNKQITLIAEVAKTEEEKSYGFMNRKVIPDGTGMIFVYTKEQTLSFWMKNTPHPLSIAYIDGRGNIKDIFDMTPYNLSSIVSTSKVMYALEVPQGWFEKNNINVGDKIDCELIKSR